ncbi:MAG: type II toxin-antitoxin system prevent-host-death family antitoxin [Bacteroidales bacterium]|nr:type II toxin-antitoxin system prevent-host-death family antitoxin [Bacteroidales bacterium]
MEITTYSNFRQNLKGFMDMVFKSRVPLFVTRSKGDDVVVLSMTDYESMQETIHLLSSPKNAERIAIALEEYKQGRGERKELTD